MRPAPCVSAPFLYAVIAVRHEFRHDGLRLSYLDGGRGDRVLIALHAHIMEAATFVPLAAVLAPEWRVLALDQRGHGYSDHAPTYTRDDYIGDLEAFIDHLGVSDSVLLGNSLGGVNAYQFAARHPERVRGLVIEDLGARQFLEGPWGCRDHHQFSLLAQDDELVVRSDQRGVANAFLRVLPCHLAGVKGHTAQPGLGCLVTRGMGTKEIPVHEDA